MIAERGPKATLVFGMPETAAAIERVGKALVCLSLALACGPGEPTSAPLLPAGELLSEVNQVEVVVGDSLLVVVQVRDITGFPIPVAPAATVVGPQVLVLGESVATVDSAGAPVHGLWVKAVALGETTLLFVQDEARLDLPVATHPAAIVIAGAPSSMASGSQARVTARAEDRLGGVLPTPVTLSSSRPSVVSVDANGLLTARGTGTAVIRADTPDGARGEAVIGVYLIGFPGTIAPTAARAGDLLTFTVSNPRFANFEVVGLGDIPVWEILSVGRSVVVPVLDAPGPIAVHVRGAEFASVDTIMVVSTDPVDVYEPNDDPLTAPPVSNGTHVIALGGNCVLGSPATPADDCSDFFTVTNATDDTVEVTVTAEWIRDLDVNILWTDEFFTTTVGNLSGATRPWRYEGSFVDVPPHTTWRLWFNAQSSAGLWDVILVEIDGLP